MSGDVLSVRALNRSTLARQLLLERADLPLVDTVDRLVGLQAQIPHNPYTALWSRLAAFRPEELSVAIEHRELVRLVLMRGTLHLVTAADALFLRPLVQPVLSAELARHREYGPVLRNLDNGDLEAVLAHARRLLDERPLTGTELRSGLAARFPRYDQAALAYACRNYLALVQVPPRGLWRRNAGIRYTTAEAWLGRPLVTKPSIDDVVMRYLAGFGPASTGDVAAWSRLTGFREVFDRLRPRLRVFRDERGRELFDVEDGLLVDPDTPAPVRFLPEYDNALLSHDDRRRFVPESRLVAPPRNTANGAVLHDGFLRAMWFVDRDDSKSIARLVVQHVGWLAKPVTNALEAEGLGLLRFLEPDRQLGGVRFVSAD